MYLDQDPVKTLLGSTKRAKGEERERREQAFIKKGKGDHTYRSYPKGSLILVKDMRPRVHKKLKPVYFKIPRMVIQEYRCTVYVSNFQGQIQKVSKNNIKMANPRSAELFAVLPDEIKMLLGDTFDEDKWKEIRDSGVVPNYFLDIELEGNTGVIKSIVGNWACNDVKCNS